MLVAATAGVANLSAQPFATGLQFPQRLLFTPAGNLLVSEGGTPEPNSGRVSLVDRSGNRRSLLEGLPSGPAHFTFPFGPTGMALDGRTLYLLIGEGDLFAGSPPNFGINFNGPSSPIFSSILKIQFSRDPDEIQAPFRLTSVSHWALLDGWDERFENGAGDRVTVQLLTAFRPLVRNVLGGGERVRQSDPNSVVLDGSKRYLYVSDSGGETISRVDITTGRALTVIRFEPHRRATPAGTVLVDNVPTGLCWSGERLLVGFLSGGPFPAEEASVSAVDPVSATTALFAGGLTAVTDIACIRGSGGGPGVVAAEFTTGQGPSGRIKVHDGSTSRIVASGIQAPTGVAVDPRTGEVYVAGLGGVILRLPAP